MNPNLLQGLALVAAVAILTSVLLRRLANRQAASTRAARERRSAPRTEPWRSKGVIDGGGQGLARSQEVILEFEGFARELEARLDTKIRVLRRLIEEAEGAAERLAGATAAAAGTAPGGEDPRRGQAERLAEEGLAPAEIAARTGLPEGEVELILGLRRRRGP